MRNILPEILRPKFQLYNSWLVPILNKEATKFNYHIFCKECGLYEISSVWIYQIKDIYIHNNYCPNCFNRNFFNSIKFAKTDTRIVNTENVFMETDTMFRCTALFHKPIVMDGRIENESEIIEERDLLKDYGSRNIFTTDSNYKTSSDVEEYFLDSIVNSLKKDSVWFKRKIKSYDYLPTKSEIVQNYYRYNCINDFELLLTTNLNQKYKTLSEYLEYVSNFNKAKSIKKYLYKSFQYMISNAEVHNPNALYSKTADFIICRAFTDVNVIVKLLKEHVFKIRLLGLFEEEFMIKFLKWLLKFYTQKQVANLLLTIKREVLRDMLRVAGDIINNQPSVFNRYFIKQTCNVQSLHDEIVRLSHVGEQTTLNNDKYKYTNSEVLMQMEILDFSFRLPINAIELYNWGELLSNCLGSYDDWIRDKESLIIGVFRDDKLLYAIEIIENCIEQASGEYNESIDELDMHKIEMWYEKVQIINNNSHIEE